MSVEYISYLFTTYLRSKNFDELFGPDWVEGESLPNIKLAAIADAFALRGFKINPQNYLEIFDGVFAQVLDAGGFEIGGDDLLGHYYRIDREARNRAVRDMLGQSDVANKLNVLGEKSFDALKRALRTIVFEFPMAEATVEEQKGVESIGELAPAADRIVRFSHNQVGEIEEPLQDIISLVEKENSVAGEDGLRELILGRLKAGQELIKAAIFSVESLQLTLIVGLKMLVERYKEHAIGAAAGNLLALLIEAIRNA